MTITTCRFKLSYYDYEKGSKAFFECDKEAMYTQPTPLCIFHSGRYLQDKLLYKIKSEILAYELKDRIIGSMSKDKALTLIGYNIPSVKLDLNFTKPVYFVACKFQGEADFSQAIFHNTADFLYAEFSKEVNFQQVTFNGAANFKESLFTNEANFLLAKFIEEANFLSAKFNGAANFQQATFTKPLSQAEFDNLPRYLREKYNSFSFVEFTKEVNFQYAVFNSMTDFLKASFNERVNFASAYFVKGASFWYVNFSKAHFYDTNFDEKVDFLGSNFYEEVDLSYTRFTEADFSEATFAKPVDFSSAKFLKKAIFSESIFNDEVNFSKAIFPSLSNDSSKDIPIRFDYSTFRKRVRFIDESEKEEPLLLESVSFKGVDLSNMEFHNVRWQELKGFFINRTIIIDEKMLDKNKNYGEVSKIYNQLRKNYESRLLFNEASNFFIGEMEAIRKSLWSNRMRKKIGSIPYFLYKVLALYGESFSLPLLLWTPILIGLFVAWRFITGQCSVQPVNDISSLSSNLSSILAHSKMAIATHTTAVKCNMMDHLIDSFAAYFQFPRSTTNPIDTIERIVSIPILGTAFLAIRRKFERIK